MLQDTYICDYKSLLVRFVCHFLNLGCHFHGSEVSKETQSHGFGFLNDTKVGVENHMSNSFLRIDCPRRFKNNDTCNANWTGRAHVERREVMVNAVFQKCECSVLKWRMQVFQKCMISLQQMHVISIVSQDVVCLHVHIVRPLLSYFFFFSFSMVRFLRIPIVSSHSDLYFV